ncbi:MAG: hypothetical protein RLZZ546_930 [Bacteroidota bacterium]
MAIKTIPMDQIEKIRQLLCMRYGNKSMIKITGFSKKHCKEVSMLELNTTTFERKCIAG